MIAKYKGRCSRCEKQINVGDAISWSRQERGKVYHLACKPDYGEATVATVAAPSRSLPDVAPPVVGMSAEELLATLATIVSRSKSVAAVEKVEVAATVEDEDGPTPEDMGLGMMPAPVAPVAPSKRLKSNSDWYEELEAVLPLTTRVLLAGPPSTGKSTTAMLLAKTQHRVTMTETTSREDLIGMFHLIDGATKWIDGPFTTAMREGQAILVDEIDRYSPECASLLYSLIDDKPHVSLPNGEFVEARPGYKVVMTTNESIETLPEAVRDRIEVILFATKPHPAALAGIAKAQQEVVMGYYGALPSRTLELTPSVRRMRIFHKLTTGGIPNETAARLVFGKDGGREVLSAVTSAEGTGR